MSDFIPLSNLADAGPLDPGDLLPALQGGSGGTPVKVRVAASGESSAAKLVRADDARLSDARPPTAHEHDAAALVSGTVDLARLPLAPSGVSSATQLVRADDSRLSNARPPTAHSHPLGELTGLTSAALGVVAQDDTQPLRYAPEWGCWVVGDNLLLHGGVGKTGWSSPTGTGYNRGLFDADAEITLSDPPTLAQVAALQDHLKETRAVLRALILALKDLQLLKD